MPIVNPGSNVAMGGNGWTNTYDKAFWRATDWLLQMRENHIRDVSVVGSTVPDDSGMWTFIFRHNVTDKCVNLKVHGIDNIDAYTRECTFPPRVYWNGNSSTTPKLTDFLCDGYEVVTRKKEA